MDVDFAARIDPFRRDLLAHCYRMLGSVHDAEDLVQETMLRAWRAFARYDPARSSMRTWLYRIATNACLTALEQRSRRPLPSGLGGPDDEPDRPLVRGEEVPWLEPVPDAMVADPTDALVSLRLAFVAALQHLPARQRAVLILREVLSWPAADVATALGMTTAAVNSALQRARAHLDAAGLAEDEIVEPGDARTQVDRYVTAFRNADLAALEKLLTDDVTLEMPPFLTWFRGRDAYLRFTARGFTLRGTDWRMLPTAANGQPAVAAYTATGDGYALHSLQVFTVTAAGISHTTVFQDHAVFDKFGLAGRNPGDDVENGGGGSDLTPTLPPVGA
ncbi:sigma-70 family RNA polymerase sigma factor [Virgisporangium aurantiacum]|uniref:sigma-70 family RNA polymerase sigma factor n=1 Tax=Virgisporangium aurantiacum TaxID=175570 RepID=UPI00357172E6